MTPKLFSPLTIKEIHFKNRIVVSPMCEYSSEDGFANDWHLVHLGSRAVGGAGLIITEAAAVSPEGRISPNDLGIWKDDHIDKLKQITAFIEEQGCVAGIQLAHAGRKASTHRPWEGGKHVPSTEPIGWKTVAPSPVPFHETDEKPQELSLQGIEKIKADFKSAASRSIEAGFKVIEIHAAHGYLIHQFLSPLSNFRTDQYGGSFDNRIRLLIEIVRDIKQTWPDKYPLFVRLSATDWADGGWDIEDSVKLSSILKPEGVDLIDCSSGGLAAHQKISLSPGYQVKFADAIKKETGILTGAVGLITEARQAEQILEENKADLILFARESLRNPYFPLQAARELGYDFKWPVQYERAKRK